MGEVKLMYLSDIFRKATFNMTPVRKAIVRTTRIRATMTTIRATVLAALATLALSAAGQQPRSKTPVLVELFTSEGCSSCPPADALLRKLEQEQPVGGAEIIVLGEHVDYWDGLGWRDRFSSHELTSRQNGYGRRFGLESVYTPQMVVDGAQEFVGNDAARARQAIVQEQKNMKIGLGISALAIDQRHVSGSVTAAMDLAGIPRGDLYAALVEPMAETEVKRGENGGRQLHHVAVVRSLQRIGSLQDLSLGEVKFTLTAPEDAVPGKERIVVFAQRSGQGAVVGVVMANILGTSSVASR